MVVDEEESKDHQQYGEGRCAELNSGNNNV